MTQIKHNEKKLAFNASANLLRSLSDIASIESRSFYSQVTLFLEMGLEIAQAEKRLNLKPKQPDHGPFEPKRIEISLSLQYFEYLEILAGEDGVTRSEKARQILGFMAEKHKKICKSGVSFRKEEFVRRIKNELLLLSRHIV